MSRSSTGFHSLFYSVISYLVLSSSSLLSAWDRTDIIFRDSARVPSFLLSPSITRHLRVSFPSAFELARPAPSSLFLYPTLFLPPFFFPFSELKAKGSRKSADSRIHACAAFYSFSVFLLFSVVFLKLRVHVHLFESITPFLGCLLSVSWRMSKAPAFPNDRTTSYYYRPVEQNHVF